MNARVLLSRTADLTIEEREAVTALSAVVYPPDEWADWPGRNLEWADPEWCVRVWDERGALASYTGIVIRSATLNDAPLRVGGVGSVKTHPAARGRGYARMAIETALEFFLDQPDVGFALLVCQPHLLPYYAALGWSEFHGRLLVLQHGNVEEFTFNRVMTHAVGSPAPTAGVIDLCGAPW